MSEYIEELAELAIKLERDRIIKLLEEKLPKTLRLVYEVCIDETGLYDPNEAALVKDAFIALIRGEQK